MLRHAEAFACASGAPAIGLHVRVDNLAVIRLYEKYGYKRRGREEYYYAREPAFFYAKPLWRMPNPTCLSMRRRAP